MNKQYIRKTLPIMTAFALLYGANEADNAFKEQEFVGPEPAIRQVQPSRARQIVRCGSDMSDYEGLEAITFLIGIGMACAVMSLGR